MVESLISFLAGKFISRSSRVSLFPSVSRTLKMKSRGLILSLILGFASAQNDDLALNYQTANNFAQLPLHCYQQEYLHKFGLVYASSDELVSPKVSLINIVYAKLLNIILGRSSDFLRLLRLALFSSRPLAARGREKQVPQDRLVEDRQ